MTPGADPLRRRSARGHYVSCVERLLSTLDPVDKMIIRLIDGPDIGGKANETVLFE